MNAVLSAEAQTRASLVLVRWMSQLDPQNGLLPKGRAAEDRVWDYADTGADLFPHLLIAATLLEPRDAPALTRIIDTEQAISSTQGLPSNINLNTDKPEKQNLEDRVYGSVEYAKDGLLPLLERLGPGPWSDRMLDIARRVDAAEPQSTRFGSIPSDSSEVNGQALQILSRAYWLTRDDELARSGARLTRAYLDLALPSTGMIPGRTWDFDRERGNTQQAQLRDHGNEIVAGLVEFHLVESALAIPEIMERRQDIHDMLGALLKLGRTKEGLWKSA
ncbi:MAG TPA: hypothetical protein VHX16_18200, partial [Chloroflexota bacterium]|nr:hypothetical protein [Chloroflexota bacterium]